jgi:hypothetical protein
MKVTYPSIIIELTRDEQMALDVELSKLLDTSTDRNSEYPVTTQLFGEL